MLRKEVGNYVRPCLFYKMVDVPYGFKAFRQDLKIMECLECRVSDEDVLRAEVGERIEVGHGIHFCKKFSELFRSKMLQINRNKKSKLVKCRFFYCKTGEVCVAKRFSIFSTNTLVTNVIIPLFEIDMGKYEGNIDDMRQIEKFAEHQVQGYWKSRQSIKVTEEGKYDGMKKRPYKCIPLYTEDEMRMAKINDDKDVLNECISRQAINGYVSLYKGEWVVGRNKEGEIVKTKETLLFEISKSDIEKRNRKISYTQSHALYGEDLKGDIYCKFTYSIENQNEYSTHVELVTEYVESEIIEDSGNYGGLHFVPLEHIEECLDREKTYYGDRIALIEPIAEEVYYEYMENVFVGKKVFVSKVMKLCEVDTWRQLSDITTTIKEQKENICNYLRGLEVKNTHESYKACIDFVSNL